MGGQGLTAMRHAYSNDGHRHRRGIESTKGVLIEQRSTPDAVSQSGIEPLVSASAGQPTRSGGNAQARGSTNTVHRRGLPFTVETVTLQRDDHEKKIYHSGYHQTSEPYSPANSNKPSSTQRWLLFLGKAHLPQHLKGVTLNEWHRCTSTA